MGPHAETPGVSVICIFKDEQRFLAEAIESVLAQTYPDFELLLVDDGSSDGSIGIARDFAVLHRQVTFLQHPGNANRGMSASRNLGLRHARGRLIAFIDGDDRWRPAKLAEQVALMQNSPEAGMLCGKVNYWSSWNGGSDMEIATGHVQDSISLPPGTSLAIYPLGTADAPCPSDVMVRRDLVDAVGGFEESFTGDLQIYEDQAFFAKLYLAAPVLFSSATWLDYRQHYSSCVATTYRHGLYLAARRHYLQWFYRHVGRTGLPSDTRRVLRRAALKALFNTRFPIVKRAATRIRRQLGLPFQGSTYVSPDISR